MGAGERPPAPTGAELESFRSQWQPPTKHGTTDHPVAIIHNGLWTYARFVQTEDERFLQRAEAAAELLLELQREDGSWRYSFAFRELEPGWVSAMAQGEGVSLLLRVWQDTHDERFFDAASKAYRFMMRPVEEGGTLGAFSDGSPILEEYPLRDSSPYTLNGSIFALWGVRDYALVTGDEHAAAWFDRLAESLAEHLDRYDTGEWTYYSLAASNPIVATPTYHAIHISQALVMAELTGDPRWREASERWFRYHEDAARRNMLQHLLRDVAKRIRA